MDFFNKCKCTHSRPVRNFDGVATSYPRAAHPYCRADRSGLADAKKKELPLHESIETDNGNNIRVTSCSEVCFVHMIPTVHAPQEERVWANKAKI